MTKLKRTTHKAKNFSKEEAQGYCLMPASHSAIAITNRLTGSQFRLWHYLMMIDSEADRNRNGEMVFRDIPSPSEIADAIGSSPRTVEKDLRKLGAVGLLPKWFTLKRPNVNIEFQIRARLQSELGGQVEVVTAVGRIDLLTESEVIEIKSIDDWKEALGKILAYAAFFPNHNKRIHLFGKPDLTKLALAQDTCSEFGVAVTFEEVCGE